MLQPVLVRPCPGGTYELIAGERRWRAAQLAGLELVPAVVAPHEDRESLELALIENMAREDLNPIEEARACSLLVDELGLTREEVGRRVGRSRVAVSNLMRLLDLPDEVLDLLVEGRLTEGHGRALLTAPDHADRRRLGPRRRRRGLDRPRDRGPRPRRRPPARGRAASRARAVHPDQLAAAERLQDAFSPRPRRRRPRRPPQGGLHRHARGRVAGRGRSAREAAIIPRRSGRLAQSVRALL